MPGLVSQILKITTHKYLAVILNEFFAFAVEFVIKPDPYSGLRSSPCT